MTDPTAHWSPSEVDDDGDRASYPPPPALDLDAIEARAAAVYPGPWRAGTLEAEGKVWAHDPEALGGPSCGERCVFIANKHFEHTANREFIAHARQDVPDLVARVRELEAQLAATEAEARVSLDALHARCDAAEAEVGRLRRELTAARNVTTPPTDDELSDEAATWIVTAPHSAGYAVRVLTSDDARRYRDTARGVHVWHLWDEATGCPAPRPAPSSAGTAAGERFAAEHPYAAGAMHGGIAHRSEVTK